MKIIPQSIYSVMFIVYISSQLVHAQSKGDKYYQKLAYTDAIVKYENFLKKEPGNLNVLNNLAQCYRLTNKSEMLVQTYARMMKVKGVDVQQKYNYALALLNNGKYDEAKIWMVHYADQTNDQRAKDYLAKLNNMNDFYKDSSSFHIEKLAINSLHADFSPALYKDGIVFASSRMQPGLITREHNWTGQPFLSLYYSKGKDNDFRTPVSFSGDIKSKFNDGPVCFNKSGEVVYITRNNIESGSVKKSSDNIVKLKIFEAQNSNGNWKKITNFPYNSNEFNCGHPNLSPDEKSLYFSSDMPGGFGGMDIYVCHKENGQWGKPLNLGSAINTSGNDIFPYQHADGTLFFASNGHLGMGGLDIYSVKPENNVFASIKNMGAPVNSYDDDFALVFDNKNKTGYFSSNREHHGTDDDIYSFSKMIVLKGIVVDKYSGTTIEDATVSLTNPATGKLEVTTLNDGLFTFPLEFDQEYAINGTKLNLGDDNKVLSTIGLSPADNPFIKLELGTNEPLFTLKVNVWDENSKEPIELAALKLNNTEEVIGMTNPQGSYNQDLASNSNMKVLVTKPGYSSKIITVTNTGLLESKDFVYDVELKRGNDLEGFEDWNKIIYYDLDKYNIRPSDAQPTLKEVVEFMKENPEVVIKLNAHTDSRASVQYNILLSKRRAIAAKNYLVDRGVNAYRIGNMNWTGESSLVNGCGDNAVCPETDHQLNRRTEITVFDINKKIKKKRN